MDKHIRVIQIFDRDLVPAGGSIETWNIDLNSVYTLGNLGLEIHVTGDGILKGEYLLSNNGVDFIKPSSAVDIFSDFTSTSGTNGDGKDIFFVDIRIPARWLKIKITETGGVNSATITAYLSIQ